MSTPKTQMAKRIRPRCTPLARMAIISLSADMRLKAMMMLIMQAIGRV